MSEMIYNIENIKHSPNAPKPDWLMITFIVVVVVLAIGAVLY